MLGVGDKMLLTMKAGDRIGGKYRLKQRIGAGGMGAVWEAVNEMTGRRVALKLILHSTPDHRRRMRIEAQACGRLEHRNIVEIYDVGETDQGDPFLIMQLLSGETLGEMLKRKRRLDPPLAARIGCDIASALVAAHDARIIHRDLKPANILLHRERGAKESEFVVKVLDFGVAKIASAGPGTQTGMLLGSQAYMSPEQVCTEKDLDHRSDLWSLGVVLFEMLAGVRPFNEKDRDVSLQVLYAPIPSVASLVRHVPAELDAIVARCLERDKMSRYQSAQEVVWAFNAAKEAIQASRVIASAPPPASNPGRPALGSASEVRPVSTGRPPMGSAPEITRPLLGEGRAGGYGDDLGVSELDEVTLLMYTTRPFAQKEPDGRLPMPSGVGTMADAAPLAEAGTGTQLLPPEEPAPSWRLEMQKALTVRRQSSSEAIAIDPGEEVSWGGTVALPRSPAGVGAIENKQEREPSVTTTTGPSVRTASALAPVVEARVDTSSRRPKRRGAVWLYSTIGAGTAAIGALVLALGLEVFGAGSAKEQVGSPGREAPKVRPEAVVVEGPSLAPNEPMGAPAGTVALPRERAVAPAATAAPLPPPKHEPRVIETASSAAPPSPLARSALSPRAPETTHVTLPERPRPECGKFIKVNCKGQPGSQKPYNPYGS